MYSLYASCSSNTPFIVLILVCYLDIRYLHYNLAFIVDLTFPFDIYIAYKDFNKKN